MVTALVNQSRFRCNHLYARAVDVLGFRLVSEEHSSQSVTTSSYCCIRGLVRLSIFDGNAASEFSGVIQ